MSVAPRPRSSRVFYGWWVVAVSSAMTFFASGIFFRGFGVFFLPIRDSLNLTNSQTALVFSVARAQGGLEGPVAGWLIDRFGNRVLLVAGIVLAGAGYIIMSFFVTNFWTFALVYLGLVSLGNSIAFQQAMFAGMNQWFRKRRSLAISALAAVASLGGLVLVPLISLMVLNLNWQVASLVAGVVYFVLILPQTIIFRNRPEDMGLLPDGDATPPTVASRSGATQMLELRDYTVNEALRTRAYWLLMAGAGLRQLASLGILVNIIPILVHKGMEPQSAANLAGVMFGVNFVSRLALGYFGDRWSKSGILAVTLALECAAFAALYFGQWHGPALILLLLFILLEGFGDGAGVIVWAALGEYYGRDRFATLRGYVTFSHSWAQIAAPVFTGWVFDQWGSYDWAIGPAIGFAGLASLSFFLIKKPPQLTKAAAPEAQGSARAV